MKICIVCKRDKNVQAAIIDGVGVSICTECNKSHLLRARAVEFTLHGRP